MVEVGSYDVVIVGAGPAGLMAALPCAQTGLRTLILDGKAAVGAKLLMSGGGRCNVTNVRVSEADYRTGGPRTVRNVLRAFPPRCVLEFFRERGVEFVLEEGTKYFTAARSSKVVLDALLEACRKAGSGTDTGRKVETLSRERGFYRIAGEGFELTAKKVVIATGGLSYPATGSDGSGYRLAKALGHTIVPTTPALTPLLTNDPDWKRLSGITLPVKLTLLADGKETARSEGALLFTHAGFSGPAVLDLSGAWLRTETKQKEVVANFLPGKKEPDLVTEFAALTAAHADRGWRRALARFVPERLAEMLLVKNRIDPQARLDQIDKKRRETFLQTLFRHPVPVTGALGYDKAEVTAGGVAMDEVDPKTLESKRSPGLYFAGEVLDVDGRIGGFNFQWAWASGTVAGRSIAAAFRAHQA